MEMEPEENNRDELMKDEYYGLILPDNSRVQEKLRTRAEKAAKIKAEETRLKKIADDISNKKKK